MALLMLPGVVFAQQLSRAEQSRFDNYFFEAERLKNIGERDAQLDALRMCLEIDSTNTALQSELGYLYLQMGRVAEAEAALRKAALAEPENWWYQSQFIRLLAGREQFEEAIEQAELLKTYFPQRDEVYNLLSSLYRQTGEFDKAIQALNQLEVYTGINEYLSFEKFQLYAMLNKEKRALKEIIRLSQKYPHENRYKVMLGDIYLELKQAKKAIKLYEQVLKAEPENPYVYVSLSNYYKEQKKEELANEAIVSALKNEKLPVETKMDILGSYVDRMLSKEEKIDETEGLFRLLIDMYPLNETTHTYYAVFLQNQKRVDEALEVFESVLNINGKDGFAWKTSLQILAEREDTTGIIKLTDRGMEELPIVPEFYFYRAMAQYQQGEIEKALFTNQLGIETLKNSVPGPVLSTFYGQVGDIYHQLDEKEESFANYEKALEMHPGNVYVLNNYAYFLSVEDTDLRKAERMSAKTVEAEPNNSTYLDTYAWIFYKQGDYSLARIYIEKAIENMKKEEQSDVILEHSGDIYEALGNREKALEMWQKALEVNDENEEVREKINNSKSELPEEKEEEKTQ